MAETNVNVDGSARPSVAQLTGRFREQAATAKEKSPPNASHPPKVKVKSSPLIEKLQANLVFNPGALLPGASPKSPGLKAAVSPFHSPPSTPSSPGVQSRASEPEEVPASFDQPPEGSHLPCYNKVRTRGSIKRRPPSRRFRRSQSDYGDLGNFTAPEPSQENGAKEENGDEVFLSKSKSPGSPPPGEGATEQEARRKLGRTPSRTEKPEEKVTAMEKAQHPEKVTGDSREEASQSPGGEEASETPQTSSPEAENECGCPREGNPAGEQMEKATEGKEERVENEEEKAPAQKNPEEEAARKEAPEMPPGEVGDNHNPEQGPGKGKQEGEAALEPSGRSGASHTQPEPDSEVPETQNDAPPQDTKI
ncbi:capZ-interacting protein isoform X2 [Talpa occidentalis]|uniref:capZ-interacting protein isoform X2 n=1 Tax=Talpa occidentalis TaxID=50954 RepID=UPI00189040AF|nr:capZ-interacting protein isoform X2 [Talpa occidentalis]